MSERYTFIGIDRHGRSRGGDAQITDLAAWVEKKFQQGWTKLTVHHVPTRINKAGQSIQIAGAEWPLAATIGFTEGHRRIWWADTSASGASS